MAVTASSMILSALVKNGVKQIGGTLTTAEQSAYLDNLNAMMASWGLERLWCYQILEESFALTGSVGTYTIGSGATFNTTRPVRITASFVRDSANADSKVEVVAYDSYASIVQKNVSGSYPKYLFYDTGFDASGFGNIKIYPLPKSGLTLFIESWKQLQQFATINDAIAMPPGYQRAIEFNFCIETAGGMKSVQPEVLKIAKESKAAIMGLNLPAPVSRMDIGVVHRQIGNIIEGP